MTRPARQGEGVAETCLRFTVPGPPVPKARARVVATKGSKAHGFTPTKTAAYEQHVGVLAMAARTQHDRRASYPTTYEPHPLAQGTVRPWSLRGATYSVELAVYRAAARGDIDNYAKAILDACNGVLWTDDGQVRDLRVSLREDKAAPRVEVVVRTGASS